MPQSPQPSGSSRTRVFLSETVGVVAFFIGVSIASGVFGALLIGLLALLAK
jgi:hypothetical protein